MAMNTRPILRLALGLAATTVCGLACLVLLAALIWNGRANAYTAAGALHVCAGIDPTGRQVGLAWDGCAICSSLASPVFVWRHRACLTLPWTPGYAPRGGFTLPP